MEEIAWAEYRAKYLDESGEYNAEFWKTLAGHYASLITH